jgi:glycine oxidase
VKHWDAIIVGAGIIGLSLAIELNKRGMKVLVVDKGEPGREASWAAGGMLADFLLETPPALRKLATASARMYPEFVHELRDESRMHIDLRDHGTLVFLKREECDARGDSAGATQLKASYPLPQPLQALEPAFDVSGTISEMTALFLQERSVDPRQLTTAAIATAKHRDIDFSAGNPVSALTVADGKAAGVRTSKTRFSAGIVVNCAGAWAGQIGQSVSAETGAPPAQAAHGLAPHCPIPTRPVKGQMLCVVMPKMELVRHVVRTPDVYLIPRTDGRMLIGATQEEAGFDKQTVPETIQKLRAAALDVVPKLAEARFMEAWAGLRPGTPDALPILGATSTPGYLVATGHFRDGILLAPVTARVMGQVIAGEKPELDLEAFAPGRF